MKRNIFEILLDWRMDLRRKPLVLRGARQVGKSYILRELGKSHYRQYHEINFQLQIELHDIFTQTRDAKIIVKQLEFKLGNEISLENDLLILDEIQDCPGAITSLKSFRETLPQLNIACAGSYIGMLSNEESFPVGQVQFLDMHPMTFREFLEGINDSIVKEYDSWSIEKGQTIPAAYHQHFSKMLQLYFAVGGLPEVVATFRNSFGVDSNLTAINSARELQRELVMGYKSDFSKHSGTVNANHIHHVFESIAQQLSKSFVDGVGKFRFTGVIPKQGRFRAIRGPLSWLQRANLVLQCPITENALVPLSAYTEENKFKLYLFDIGILNCMLGIPPQMFLDEKIDNYKGYLAENFIAQELIAKGEEPVAFHRGNSEIEFLIYDGSEVIPIEVKSSAKSRKAKSLDAYIKRYAPKHAFKLTGQNFGMNTKKNIITLPLYFCCKI